MINGDLQIISDNKKICYGVNTDEQAQNNQHFRQSSSSVVSSNFIKIIEFYIAFFKIMKLVNNTAKLVKFFL